MHGVFVDANESLAVIFERLERSGDPKVRVHRLVVKKAKKVKDEEKAAEGEGAPAAEKK